MFKEQALQSYFLSTARGVAGVPLVYARCLELPNVVSPQSKLLFELEARPSLGKDFNWDAIDANLV